MLSLMSGAYSVAVLLSLVSFSGAAEKPTTADWPNPGNDKSGTRYSTLDQINRQNVSKLEVAWTYRVDDADASKNTTIECTPLVVDGVMYVTTVTTKVVALDAATGKELWRFEPYGDAYGGPTKKWQKASGGVNRGVAFWWDGKPKDQGGQRRVIHGLSDGRLVSLD